jgi:hypothetical protein
MGTDIHKQNKETIERNFKIPEQIRVEWGVFKNLLNGFTTVVHHGKYLNIKNPLNTHFSSVLFIAFGTS